MYNLFITEKSQKQVLKLSKNDARHVREIISLCLGTYLKKTSKRCNKKLIGGSKYETYRLHVSMTYTVFYRTIGERFVGVAPSIYNTRKVLTKAEYKWLIKSAPIKHIKKITLDTQKLHDGDIPILQTYNR